MSIVVIFFATVLFTSKNTVFADEIPEFVEWNECMIEEKEVSLALRDRSVSIYKNSNKIWTSPSDYFVQDLLYADIDRDNVKEIILLAWKMGRYGEKRPFFITDDEKKWSQHIYIYEIDKDTVRAKWMASDIGMEAVRFAVDDNGILIIENTDKNTSLWYWRDFGLKNLPNSTKFLAVGDNLIHVPIYTYGYKKTENNYDHLYENVKDIIIDADIAIINNETILVDDPKMYSTYPCFGTPVEVGKAAIDAGFDVMSCATNHALDKGKKGIDTTEKFYRENDVLCLGIQSSEDQDERKSCKWFKKNGMNIAFFNYTYGTNGIKLPKDCPYMVNYLDDDERIRNEIEEVKAEADFIIVCVHWGDEYSRSVSAYQKKWAGYFNECGVDVVIGTHPHVLEPYEMMVSKDGHKTLVYYSLGNFMSAQYKRERVVGGMAEFSVFRTMDGYEIGDYSMEGIVTHQPKGSGRYTVYMLNDYTEELAAEHTLGITLEQVKDIYLKSIEDSNMMALEPSVNID